MNHSRPTSARQHSCKEKRSLGLRHSLRSPQTAFSRTGLVVGAVLLLVALVGVAYPLWWNHRASHGAAKLLGEQRKLLARAEANTASGKSCVPIQGPGILHIPSLGLLAPVQQGLSDSVLNISVGHDPSTAWPGPKSAALLAAHDVSFFSHLDQLRVGELVTYTVPCATYTYRVTGSLVTSPGAPIPIPGGGGVVLDTCWPPNALWFTPDRYLVTANYVSEAPQSAEVTAEFAKSNPTKVNLVVKLPPGLSPGELSLTTNSQIMGKMTFVGTPSSEFEQSNGPLQVEAAALQAWFASIHTLEASQPSWWPYFAPGVPYPKVLSGKSLRSTSALQIEENVSGSTARSVVLTGELNGQSITVSENITAGVLEITKFSVS